MHELVADTRVLFTAFVALVALQRLAEVAVSSRHARRMLERGGREAGRGHLPPMIALHVALLVAAPAEVWLLDRPAVPPLAWAAAGVFAVAQALRAWTLETLGDRWTVRVIAVPGDTPVAGGPYRYLRHPNYLVVAAEVAAVPLLHGAWLTALVFSALNAWLLAVRIRAEEALLAETSGYEETMRDTPRLLPTWRVASSGTPPASGTKDGSS